MSLLEAVPRTTRPVVRRPNLWWGRIKRLFSLLVWLGCVAVALGVHASSMGTSTVYGVAEVRASSLSPLETGRVLEVLVTPGQKVKKGDILARMDASVLEAESNALAAREERRLEELRLKESLARLQQDELRESISGFQQEILDLEREFARDVENLEHSVYEGDVVLQKKRVEIAERERELKKWEQLLRDEVVATDAVEELRIRLRILRRELELLPGYLEGRKRHLAGAEKRYQAMKNWISSGEEDIGTAIEEKWKLRNKRLNEQIGILRDSRRVFEKETRESLNVLRLRRERYVLTAPRDGIVSEILVGAGEVVPVGTPILRLTEPGATRVVGILPEEDSTSITIGQKVTVRQGGESLPGRIEVIHPSVERFEPLGSRFMRGRRFIILLDPPAGLVPGQAVKIELKGSWW